MRPLLDSSLLSKATALEITKQNVSPLTDHPDNKTVECTLSSGDLKLKRQMWSLYTAAGFGLVYLRPLG